MSRLALRPEAADDLDEAAGWYESQRDRLGGRFLDEVEALLARIAESPQQFPDIAGGVQRGLLQKFPYGVYFTDEEGAITVLGVLHLHRQPGELKHRF